jgi:hypothetical protein
VDHAKSVSGTARPEAGRVLECDAPGDVIDLVPFTFDLTAHEIRRLTAVLDATPGWIPLPYSPQKSRLMRCCTRA